MASSQVPTNEGNDSRRQRNFYNDVDPTYNSSGKTYGQQWELQIGSLMPQGYSDPNARVQDGSDYAYAPTQQAVEKSVISTGSVRHSYPTRDPMGRKVGTPCLLRSQPMTPLTRGSDPWFNNSSFRADVLSGTDTTLNARFGYANNGR
jgi:hypothetical protein